MTTIEVPHGFRLERGLLWPAMDRECSRVIFDMAKDLEPVMKHVRRFEVCVQAGGNCGVWPRALAVDFGTVYTAEPNPMNFVALTHNTGHLPNVVRFQAALGFDRGMVKTWLADHELANCGAFYVVPGGSVPTLRVDDLALDRCGLLYLDIEGFEFQALKGAAETIQDTLPVIVIEDKGLSDKYGTAKGHCEKWLADTFHYRVAERIHRDVILVPRM